MTCSSLAGLQAFKEGPKLGVLHYLELEYALKAGIVASSRCLEIPSRWVDGSDHSHRVGCSAWADPGCLDVYLFETPVYGVFPINLASEKS
jgi:hypothetical protein